jgi:hypothetical protein
LDDAEIAWAVFAGAAANAYGATRPLTDVDSLVPQADRDKSALDWDYLHWRARTCAPQERVQQALERLETVAHQMGKAAK